MVSLSFAVASANVCSNPERAQSNVTWRTAQAFGNSDVTFGQEITPARYKSAWSAEAKKRGRVTYGNNVEVPISLSPQDWHVDTPRVVRAHGGLAKVSPSRYFTVVAATRYASHFKVAFINVHTVSKGYDAKKGHTTSWNWRHSNLLAYWKALSAEVALQHSRGYTVIVGGDCNWPNPPKPNPEATALVESGLDHLWIIPAKGVSFQKSATTIRADLSRGMDHPILISRVTLSNSASIPAKESEKHVLTAPSPTYVGPPKWHGAASNKPIHRYVIHATVGAEPGVRGAARSTVNMTKHTSRPSSYHYISDSRETLQLTYDSVVAYHAPPNSHSIGHELSCSLSGEGKGHWARDDHQAMLKLVAKNCAQACLFYDIPLVKLSAADLRSGKRGICGHIDVSNAFHQSSHWDPGPYFPWADFMRMVHDAADEIKGSKPILPPEPEKVNGPPTRIQSFRNNYHATHQLDMGLLDQAITEERRVGSVKNVRDAIDHLMKSLPHDRDNSLVNQAHAYYDTHRIIKMGMLSDAIKAGRSGNVEKIRNDIIKQVDNLPAS